MHAAVTPTSLPISIATGRGDEAESRRPIPLSEGVRVEGPRGRPRKRPRRVHADTVYDTMINRMRLKRRHIHADLSGRTKHPTGREASPLRQGAPKRVRYSVERFFSRMRCFGRIDSRHDRSADAFSGFVHMGCTLILARR